MTPKKVWIHLFSINRGCRIKWRHLCKGVNSSSECPDYDTKQSDCEALVTLKLWGKRSILLLPSFPGPLWSRVVALDRVLSMDQIELNWIILNWIAWNRTSNTEALGNAEYPFIAIVPWSTLEIELYYHFE